ncbi:DUF7269 family protein [Halosimplex salinum]|uniref:DUF7269 family protein n=1 Tax=Halosimplex salinum TaxID=1710538 RepID=UPI000F496D88|nr:hypothetical protein [Halosimplex salinum]
MSSVGPRDPGDSRSWTAVGDRPRPDRRWLRVVAVVVGVLSLALAVALVTGVGGGQFAEAIVAVVWPGRIFVFVFAHFALVLGAWSLWRVWTAPGETDEPTLPAPGETEDVNVDLVGSDLDTVLERLGDPNETVRGWKRVDVRSAVRSVAVDALVDAGYEYDDLKTALETGAWTDDPRAATYLGDDVPLPIRLRVVDWASGDPYRRQVRAAVAELAELTDVETEVERP